MTGSLACKMKHFVQNKSQATKTLEVEENKIGQINSKSLVNVKLNV